MERRKINTNYVIRNFAVNNPVGRINLMGVKSKLSSKMASCRVAFLSTVNLTESNTDLKTHVTNSQAIKPDFHEFVYFA